MKALFTWLRGQHLFKAGWRCAAVYAMCRFSGDDPDAPVKRYSLWLILGVLWYLFSLSKEVAEAANGDLHDVHLRVQVLERQLAEALERRG